MAITNTSEHLTLAWSDVLSHREPDQVPEIASRLASAGVTPDMTATALADSGEMLASRMESGDPGWEQDYGGMLGVALLAGEVSAQAAFRVSQASNVRSGAVNALLDEYSAVFVASQLGISRQKVYEIGRAASKPHRGRR